jgi:hypothetical protein
MVLDQDGDRLGPSGGRNKTRPTMEPRKTLSIHQTIQSVYYLSIFLSLCIQSAECLTCYVYSECNGLWTDVNATTNNMMCIQPDVPLAPRTSVCNGDEGSPVVDESGQTVYGLVSPRTSDPKSQ